MTDRYSTLGALSDEIEAARWAQCKEVVRLRDEKGLTPQLIARGWINPQTGRAYGPNYVVIMARIWDQHGQDENRPAWTNAYEVCRRNRDAPDG
jgi:hypothetical protein